MRCETHVFHVLYLYIRVVCGERLFVINIGSKAAENAVQNSLNRCVVIKHRPARNVYKQRIFLHFRIFFSADKPSCRVGQRAMHGYDIALAE